MKGPQEVFWGGYHSYLSDSELRFPYEGSKTLMHVFDRFGDTDLITELLEDMYEELPTSKPRIK